MFQGGGERNGPANRVARQKALSSSNSLEQPFHRHGVPLDGGVAYWLGASMARKLQGQHLEITREAVHLVPPRVGAAPAAVNQDQAVTPQGPSRPRASVRNRQ